MSERGPSQGADGLLENEVYYNMIPCSLLIHHLISFSHVEEALDLMLEVLVMEKAGDEVGAFAAEDAAGKDSPLGDDGFEGVNDPQLEVPIQEEL